jgi:hypothetical protein
LAGAVYTKLLSQKQSYTKLLCLSNLPKHPFRKGRLGLLVFLTPLF